MEKLIIEILEQIATTVQDYEIENSQIDFMVNDFQIGYIDYDVSILEVEAPFYGNYNEAPYAGTYAIILNNAKVHSLESQNCNKLHNIEDAINNMLKNKIGTKIN